MPPKPKASKTLVLTPEKSPAKASSSSQDSSTLSGKIYADESSSQSSDSKTAMDGETGISESLQLLSAKEAFGKSSCEDNNKRTISESDNVLFKHLILQSFEEIFSESPKEELRTDELYELFTQATSVPFDSNDALKKRLVFLHHHFSGFIKEIPDAYRIVDVKSVGYSLLLKQSNMMFWIAKHLREKPEFSLTDNTFGWEFIQIMSELNMILIQMGIKNGFTASELFMDQYKSGGSVGEITQKEQEKAIKRASKEKEAKQLDSVVKGRFQQSNFRKFQRNNTHYSSNNNSQQSSQHNYYNRRGFSNYSNNNHSYNNNNNNQNNNYNNNNSNNNHK
jgi:hypothetical protein